MAEYPEHEKMSGVREDSQRLGEFLDWLGEQGYVIAEWKGLAGYEYHVPVRKTINQWLAEFYDIDLEKIDAEKEAMLQEIRAHREEKHD